MKCVLIDNYDSFTFNLVHLVRELGIEVSVLKNDEMELSRLKDYDAILLSPGPGVPSEAGLLMDVIRTYADKKPILGVCLGHQAIAEVFGARLEKLPDVFHGISDEIHTTMEIPLFSGLGSSFVVGRYHSWVVSRIDFPTDLEITAETVDGKIMALRHKHLNVQGIQFHPESVLTPKGKEMLNNWLVSVTSNL